MAKQGKRRTAIAESIDREKLYSVDEAVKLIKQNAKAKFDETIEVALNLGVDPRHADQMVRGTVNLPMAPASLFGSRCSPRVIRRRRPRPRVPMWSALMISPKRFRAVRSISIAASPPPT